MFFSRFAGSLRPRVPLDLSAAGNAGGVITKSGVMRHQEKEVRDCGSARS